MRPSIPSFALRRRPLEPQPFKHARLSQLPFNLCTHIQNSSRARLKFVNFAHSGHNLSIATLLLRHGFIQNVTLGNHLAPSPELFKESTNPAERRIWTTLKYRDEQPVMMNCGLVSKPGRRVFMTPDQLKAFVRGGRVWFVKPVGMGEVAFVHTGKGWMEAREAIRHNLGGEVVVRVS